METMFFVYSSYAMQETLHKQGLTLTPFSQNLVLLLIQSKANNSRLIPPQIIGRNKRTLPANAIVASSPRRLSGATKEHCRQMLQNI
jgi:hypothetical protein